MTHPTDPNSPTNPSEEANPFDAPADPFGAPPEADDDEEISVKDEDIKLQRIPKGTYTVKCIDVVNKDSQAGSPMFTFFFAISQGQHAGTEFRWWCVRTSQQLWKLEQTLMALGVKKVNGELKVRKSELINKECLATVADDEYDGQDRSKLTKLKAIR